jgi:sugar lactone lactonase YvrE
VQRRSRRVWFAARLRAALTLLLALLPGHRCGADREIERESDYVLDGDLLVAIPMTYTVEGVISYLGGDAGFMNGPEDLFVAEDGTLYVADTGNDRVLRLDDSGRVLAVYRGPPDKPFSKPSGVYVAADGSMLVADTMNFRVAHLDPAGELIEVFLRPDSPLLEEHMTFDPARVFLSPTGYLYVLNKSNYMGFMTIDTFGRFRGFIGSTKVGFSLQSLMIRLFASPEQRVRLAKRQAPPFSNFVIHDDGFVYAAAIGTPAAQIKKLNSVGMDVFAGGVEKRFGLSSVVRGRSMPPEFADIAVTDAGIVCVLDRNTGEIWQYDQDGDNIAIIGGKGLARGSFEAPVSLAVAADGRLFVLDTVRRNIQILAPTAFVTHVHVAIELYGRGRYAEARTEWETVLGMDATYPLAHRGIARALIKEGRFAEAMSHSGERGKDRATYTRAFVLLRHEVFRRHFTLIVLATVLSAAAIALAGRGLRRASGKLVMQGWTRHLSRRKR